MHRNGADQRQHIRDALGAFHSGDAEHMRQDEHGRREEQSQTAEGKEGGGHGFADGLLHGVGHHVVSVQRQCAALEPKRGGTDRHHCGIVTEDAHQIGCRNPYDRGEGKHRDGRDLTQNQNPFITR